VSQAERRERQAQAAADQAAAMLRQRQALTPKRIPVLVSVALASLDGGIAWREISHSTLAYTGYLRAQRMPYGVSGVVQWQ
jgi:hypothetical protein